MNKDVDTVRAYLCKIGKVPLLSPEEEIAEARKVQAYENIIKNKKEDQEEWARSQNMTIAELQRAIAVGKRAKEKMIRANLRLVVAIAKKYSARGMELLDLIQEGNIGLNRAVEKFDPNKGYKFSTYAYWWIRQAITRAIAEQGRTVRLPVHISETVGKIRRACREFARDKNRQPSIKEIAIAVGKPEEKIREVLSYLPRMVSLNALVGDDKDTELMTAIADPKSNINDLDTDLQLIRTEIDKLLYSLTMNEREVIIQRFGFEGHENVTLQQIGNQLLLSRERIRQLEASAFKKMKRQCTTSRVRDFLECFENA